MCVFATPIHPSPRGMGSLHTTTTSSSFTILTVALAGILAFSILLLVYYYLFLDRPSSSSSLLRLHYSPPAPAAAPEPARGLDHAAIRRIPTFRYRQQGDKEAGSECSVCLSEFRDGERLRLLPACRHAFHIDCIDAWLQATANCPLCRAALSPPHVHIDLLQQPHSTNTAAIVSPPSFNPARDGHQQPMRRSFSMDSSRDKRLYQALQEALRHSADGRVREESSSRTGSLRTSFFSFNHRRSSSTAAAILPISLK